MTREAWLVELGEGEDYATELRDRFDPVVAGVRPSSICALLARDEPSCAEAFAAAVAG